MTWNMGEPIDGNHDRVLTGNSLQLFQYGVICISECVGGLLDDIGIEPDDEEDGYLYANVEIFKQLSRREQIDAVAYVLKYLTKKTNDVPPQTAWAEATILQIYNAIIASIEIEIDCPDHEGEEESSCRKKVFELCKHELADKEFAHLYPEDHKCVELDKWEFLIEGAKNEILWDRDFEITELVAESVDEVCDDAKFTNFQQDVGIIPGYFNSMPPKIDDSRERIKTFIQTTFN